MSWSILKRLQDAAGLGGVARSYFRSSGPKHRRVEAWTDAHIETLELREGRSNIEKFPKVEKGDKTDKAAVRALDLDALRSHVLVAGAPTVDYSALAARISERFPRIGEVKYLGDDAVDFNAAMEKMSGLVAALGAGRGDADADIGDPLKSHAFDVNGAIFTITEVPFPLVYDVEEEGLHPFRSFDPREVIATHTAQFVIQAPKPEDDVEWTKAQASVLTFFSAALAEMTPAKAVYWRASQCFAEAHLMDEYADAAYQGRAPVLFWVQFYPIYIEDMEIDDKRLWGIATLGMEPFVGREVESAPEPQEPFDALTKVGPVCEYMLNQGVVIQDGETLSHADGGNFLYIREVERFFRPDKRCFLLIAPDSIIDPVTLMPKE